MKRKGLGLFLVIALLAGFLLPLPECYITKVNCPRKSNGIFRVPVKQCQSAKASCGSGCPFAQSSSEQGNPENRYELLQKLKSYPVRSLLTSVADAEWAYLIATDSSSVVRAPFQEARFIRPINGCERASPILLQKQSLLI
ncbi:MAG: hypothetical protein AB1473_08950 [Thermodesulfobacteriota bacterium]